MKKKKKNKQNLEQQNQIYDSLTLYNHHIYL